MPARLVTAPSPLSRAPLLERPRLACINQPTERLLSRARAGDELAFRELTDPFRRELELHCYLPKVGLSDEPAY